MAIFIYNNAKNASTGYMPFKLNYSYYLRVSFKENTNLCSKSKSANRLLAKLQELMTVCRKNIYYTQKLQKQANDKGVKSRSYAPSDKIWLNGKYIKTKKN